MDYRQQPPLPPDTPRGIQYNRAVFIGQRISMLPYIVEPEQLASRLSESRLLIVDLSSEETWQRMHLPGARHVQPSQIVGGAMPAPGKLPDLPSLQALVDGLGLTPDHHVVAYDDEGGGWAGRMIWTLDMIGHRAHSYLNGGLVSWSEEGFPVTSELSAPPETASGMAIRVAVERSAAIDKEELSARLGDANLVIWDARSPEEFNGTRRNAARGGHIPGAVNLEWLAAMDRRRGLRIRQDIREQLATLGITGEHEIVTYCQTHHRSGLTYVIGKALGFDIRAYDGSWSEWGNDPTLPVEC